ncbi:MAG: hypothetical protein LQ350_002350 [Teloschistes chrysophthalmus]|nr:MAG: hypothetical protein LQ350_002350 [Niorma chrysophthalma]
MEGAASMNQVKATLAELSEREASVTDRLDALVASQNNLKQSMVRLDILRANVGSQAVSIRSISNGMLSTASATAQKISGAVSRLDLEQARVKGTLDVVEQVAELKTCVLGVTGSMGAAQDWEAAASYLNRASRILPEVVNGSFAEEIVPTSEVPDAPKVTLEEAAESLRGLFLREFEKAAEENNGSRVTRFFKLFPLIGKPEVGLDVYGRYVCQGVATRARSNLNAGTAGSLSTEGFFYANAMTKLFEHIAQITEQHGGLVELHYGPGRAIGDSRSQREEGIDTKEIDALLNEMTVMAARWSLYCRFITLKFKESSPNQNSDDEMLRLPSFVEECGLKRKITDRLMTPVNSMTTFILRRAVERAFQLDEQPLGLSLNPSKPLQPSPPYISSAVDDVMYIVNQIVERSLATSQRQIISSVIPSVARVLDSDFIGMIQRKMRDESYPKAAIQGALPPENTIIAFLVLINDLDLANDYVRRIVQSRIESQQEVRSSANEPATSPRSLVSLYPFAGDASYVRNALISLQQNFEAKASELIGDGVYVVFKNVVKPRLRPLLSDALRNIDYQMNENEIDDVDRPIDEDNGPGHPAEGAAQSQFQRGWDALTKPIARIFSEGNFERLLFTIISYLAEVLEKRIWSYYGRINDLRAIRLERDIANLINIVVRGGRYGLRNAFVRCTQICVVMNMEEDEWAEIQASDATNINSGLEWKLDADERLRARAMVLSVK